MELEEMKKHQIKAQPISMNILKGPSMMKKVAKKPSTVPKPFHLTQPKKVVQPDNVTISPPKTLHNKESHPKNAVYTIVNNGTTIAVKNENVQHAGVPFIPNTKPAMRTTPFSFEMRNKEFQMKKEEKLKNLQMQEINKIKAEFHARPAPNFTKTSAQTKEINIKKSVATLKPFSFDERDKCLLKMKEQVTKQISEENKTHQFHANPVPVFKPVTVCGMAKENVTAKKKVAEEDKKPIRQIKKCIGQENKQPNIIADTKNNPSVKAKLQQNKEDRQSTIDNEQLKKQSINLKRSSTLKDNKIKPLPIELNTDKRARERREFDEKLRRKEREGEQKRQQEERDRLEKEKIETMKLRKLAEVKATPLPVYKPLVIAKSTKPLTAPQSPAWGNKAKAKPLS
ncbi:hypothetical protein KM043_008959 [Ampulex compressa]|nr:hypothetical protein KM043_008959 [Ampulex compressa]